MAPIGDDRTDAAGNEAEVSLEDIERRTGAAALWARMAGFTVRTRSDLLVALLDAVLVSAAFTAMLILRFDGSVPARQWDGLLGFLPLAIVVAVLANWAWGLYGQLWRHASLYEARRLTMSGLTMLVILAMFEWGSRNVPISVIVSGALVATFLMAVLRFQSRLFSFRRGHADDGLKVVVIGAGDAGAGLVAEMIRVPRMGFRPVAVLDENPSMHGKAFMGVTVLGGIDALPEVVKRTEAHLAVFAKTSADQATLRRAAARAEEADIALKIVPGISSAINGGASLRDLRDLRIEDLLGREQVATDLDAVGAMLRGQRVLITGAGGSIGSEISRQVASFAPERLVLLDHDETHLHDVAAELDGPVVQVLADIRDGRLVSKIFAEHRPSVVFHAAAHKHVPLLEAHPTEAVLTNVVGTSNLLDAAAEVGVRRLVFISTDKAVYPSSVMGASKRLGEQLVINRAPEGAAYCAVRFGNVLGSRGSVVPTFMRQIEAGGPVTVTDRRMTRFFMSIREAVQLVLQAGALTDNSTGGEVFMLDMGEPVVIYDLAERMIRLSGRKPGTDIEIEITGVRPGEKLVEELKALNEAECPTAHASISRVSTVAIDAEQLEKAVIDLADLAGELDNERCGELLRAMAASDRVER